MGRRAWILVMAASAACLALVILVAVWSSKEVSQPFQITEESVDRQTASQKSGDGTAIAFDQAPTQPPGPESAARAANSQDFNPLTPIPAEWEVALASILLDRQQPMNVRNARLMELATIKAAQVPRVQQECLMHLAFGLPDEDQDTFLAVCSSSKIPVSLRERFLDQVLAIRPTTLCVPLCERILQLGEPSLSAIAQDYLSAVAEETATP
jgi:hypothetical protein